MAVFNGTELLLQVDGDVIGHTTSCSLTISHDLPDATTKDSGGWAEVISGLRSGELSFEGLIDYSDTTNAPALADAIINRTKITCIFGTSVTGDTIYTADGYVASIEQTAEMEASVTYSGTITITGAIVPTVNA